MPFLDQIVWISGASSGIGAALAVEFSRHGAKVVLSARRTEVLEEVRQQCDRPDDHMVLALDVAESSTHAAAFEKIVARYDRVDIVVANAGVDQRSRAGNTPLSIERRIMEVNYFGAVSMVHCVLPSMQARNTGHIAIVSSVMGYISTPQHSSYAASKHALHGYFEGLRAELVRSGIDVTMLCPGYIKTEISIHALRRDGSEHGKMDSMHSSAMSAETFARRGIRAIRRRRSEVLIGGPEILTIYAKRFFPRLFRFLMPRLYHLVANGNRPK
jgi:dehydrogenase/reductase SDR family protein 7B